MAAKRPPNKVTTLPSGLEVAYWDSIGVDGKPQQRRYRVAVDQNGDPCDPIDGVKFASISTVAGVYDKPGLMPAAVKLQEAGVIELAKRGVNIAGLTQESLRALLVEHGLHYDSIWGVARDRGDISHDMLVKLLRDGKVAKLSQYDADLRPWIQAGMRWAVDAAPEEILAAEYIVASLTLKVAGRGDLLYRKRDGRIARTDFKTVTEWKVKKNS
jgi:hypothetical protein